MADVVRGHREPQQLRAFGSRSHRELFCAVRRHRTGHNRACTADSTGNVPSEAAVRSARTTSGLDVPGAAPAGPASAVCHRRGVELDAWRRGRAPRAGMAWADVWLRLPDASADLRLLAVEMLLLAPRHWCALKASRLRQREGPWTGLHQRWPLLTMRGSIEAALGDIAEAGRGLTPFAFTAAATR